MLKIGENLVDGTVVLVAVNPDGNTTVTFPSFVDETNTPLALTFDSGVALAVISTLVQTIVWGGNPYI